MDLPFHGWQNSDSHQKAGPLAGGQEKQFLCVMMSFHPLSMNCSRSEIPMCTLDLLFCVQVVMRSHELCYLFINLTCTCLQDTSSLSLSSSVLQVLECIQVTWGFCFAWLSGTGAAPEILHFQQAPRCHHTSCLQPRLGVVRAFSHRGGTKLSSYCSSKHNILFPIFPCGFLLF